MGKQHLKVIVVAIACIHRTIGCKVCSYFVCIASSVYTPS